MLDKVFGAAGASVVIEEFMDGEEASFFAFTDGKNVLPLASSQDHKRAFDNDEGPNTGGMGAYSPAPVVTPALHDEIVETIVKPTIAGMASDGCPYSGILYVGLMIKNGKPRVVEYNARFGDPEAQPLLMRMKSDIVPVLQACARGNLQQDSIEWHDKAAVCVVLASGGYPAKYAKGFEIMGLDDVTAGFSAEFAEMRSKTGWESFVGVFSTAKSESLRQERMRTASVDDKLQDLIAKSGITPYFGRDAQLKTTVKLRVIGRQQQLLRVDFENTPQNEVLSSQTQQFIQLSQTIL